MPVNISGVQGTLKAMREFDNDLYKGMNKEIKAAMLPIRDKARGFAPANSSVLSGWTKAGSSNETINYRPFPKYDQGEVQKGITYNQGGNKRNAAGFSMTHYVANRSAGGAIYETAGRKNPNGQPVFQRTAFTPASYRETGRGFNKSLNPNAGRQFIASAGQVYGNSRNYKDQGRLIFRAWYEDQGKASRAVNLAIESAVKTFNTTNTQAKYTLGA
jgi:hypothetical protein